MRWGIVADDLTGAADAAAPFATAGLRTCVVLEPVVLPKRYDCIALDAEARWRTADEAAERIATFVAKLRDADGLMLKVDSTLRGFVGAMVKAAWQASRRHWALFAPAVPTQGRLVRDGKLFVHETPIHQSPFASEPPAPITDPRIAHRLETTGLVGRQLVHASLAAVRNPQRLRQLFARAMSMRACVIADAETDDDLRQLVTTAMAMERPPLWVGAMGLTRAIAHFVKGEWVAPKWQPAKRILCVIGSPNPVSLRQWQTLQRHGAVGLTLAPPLRQELPAEGIVAVRLVGLDRLVQAMTPQLLRRYLRSWLTSWLRLTPNDALVLVGGFTARMVADVLRATRLEVFGELEAGVPFGMFVRRRGVPLLCALKAGGFGTPMTLQRVAQKLLASP